MSLKLAPLETIAAEGLTGLFISAGAKGDAKTIVKRANATLAIVTAIGQIEGGDTVAGLTALTAALGSTDLDPGEALALQGLLSQLGTQAALINSILGSTLGGQVASSVAANIAAGVSAACNAELAKYAGAGSTAPAAKAA